MTVDDRPPRAHLLFSWFAASLVVVGGIVVLLLGLQRIGAAGDERAVIGRLPRVGQPVVVTVPGLAELSGSTVRVRASSSAASVPVFIGVGRADDVEAYLGDVARAEVTAVEGDATLRVVDRAGAPSLPDPAGVDVWAASVRAAGVAVLTWPRMPGQWRLVIATDGRTPPLAAEFTWSEQVGASPAPALISVGAILVAVGIAALLALRSGRLRAAVGGGRAASSPGAADEGGGDPGDPGGGGDPDDPDGGGDPGGGGGPGDPDGGGDPGGPGGGGGPGDPDGGGDPGDPGGGGDPGGPGGGGDPDRTVALSFRRGPSTVRRDG